MTTTPFDLPFAVRRDIPRQSTYFWRILVLILLAADDDYTIRFASEDTPIWSRACCWILVSVLFAADDDYTVRFVNEKGHTDTVESLLLDPRVDPVCSRKQLRHSVRR
jgi:hypothetical protein